MLRFLSQALIRPGRSELQFKQPRVLRGREVREVPGAEIHREEHPGHRRADAPQSVSI